MGSVTSSQSFTIAVTRLRSFSQGGSSKGTAVDGAAGVTYVDCEGGRSSSALTLAGLGWLVLGVKTWPFSTGPRVHRHLRRRFRRRCSGVRGVWHSYSRSGRPSRRAAARICLSLRGTFLFVLRADVAASPVVAPSSADGPDSVDEADESVSSSSEVHESDGPDADSDEEISECLATKRTVLISSSSGKR
jgi:hypothetical protein